MDVSIFKKNYPSSATSEFCIWGDFNNTLLLTSLRHAQPYNKLITFIYSARPNINNNNTDNITCVWVYVCKSVYVCAFMCFWQQTTATERLCEHVYTWTTWHDSTVQSVQVVTCVNLKVPLRPPLAVSFPPWGTGSPTVEFNTGIGTHTDLA